MGGLRESGQLPPAQQKRWDPGGGGAVSGNPDQVLHLTKETPSLAPSARGEGPQVGRSLDHSWKPGAFPGPGGEGPEGYLLLQTLSGLSEAINSPGPSPQSSGQSLGKMGNHKGCKDPISLLWLKHCSSSFAIADITRSLFYKCRGPWIEQYPILPWRGGPGSRTSSRTSSLEPSHSSGAPAATYPHLGISRKNNF